MNNIGIMVGALIIAPLVASQSYTTVDMLATGTPLNVLPVDQIGNVSVYGLAFGAVLSALAHLLVQLPGLFTIRAKLRPLANWRIEGVLEVLRLMGPRVLGLGVVQINFVVNIILTDTMIEGSLVALNTAFMLMFFALGIIGQSVGSAVFPTLAALYAENDMEGYKNRLANAIRSVLFLAFPATVAFMVLGEALVSIFERGKWTPESTQATAWALSFYAIGIAGFALLEVLSRAFYALSDTWTPVVIGIAAMLSNIVLSIVFIQFIGDADNLAHGSFAGLALANASTTLAEALVLWWLMRRRIGNINDGFIFSGSVRALLAALLMGVILWVLPQFVPFKGFSLAIIGAIVGGTVFGGVSILLGLEEAKAVPLMILRRLKR
jgi:putative peptidoglycan lipid II flippase